MLHSHSAPSFGSALRRRGVLALASLALLMPVAVGSAQTPEGSSHAAHPAHIHAGSCAELGEVVYPLADVALPGAR